MKTVNDVQRLQALVDKKKVIITEATIRDALRLDDTKGINCLPNEEIFTELCMNSKRTSWNEFSSSMASAVICLSTGMIVAPQAGEGAAKVNVDNVSATGIADEGTASVAVDDVPVATDEPTIPLPTSPTQPPPPSQDQPFTSQRVKKLERRNKLKVLKLRRLKKVGTAQRVETSDDTVMDDEVPVDAEIEESVDVHGRQEKSQAQIYQI
nr:hypothetical protein [Tanacetum cinerariifolium]